MRRLVPSAGSKRRTRSIGKVERDSVADSRRLGGRNANRERTVRRLHVEKCVGAGIFAPQNASADRTVGGQPNALGPNPGDSSAIFKEIHRTLAEKARDAYRTWRIVNALRFTGIFDSTVHEHREQIADAHRFDVIVRDVEDRTGKPLTNADDFIAHGASQRRIEMRQRLVEQQCERIRKQRAGDRGALALATGKLARSPVEMRLKRASAPAVAARRSSLRSRRRKAKRRFSRTLMFGKSASS